MNLVQSEIIFDESGLKEANLQAPKSSPQYEKMRAWAADPKMLSEISERFWNGVSVGEPESCWMWNRHRDPRGYGRINIFHHVWLAHRISFLLNNGHLEESMHICHHCDNPPCCNPAHLFEGTDLDNQRDACLKGRHIKGEDMSNSKLSVDLVKEIRGRYVRRKFGRGKLAAAYGVSSTCVQKILERKMWAWVS